MSGVTTEAQPLSSTREDMVMDTIMDITMDTTTMGIAGIEKKHTH